MLNRIQYSKVSALAAAGTGACAGGWVGAILAGSLDAVSTLGYWIFAPTSRDVSTAALKAECDTWPECNFEEQTLALRAQCKCYTYGREDECTDSYDNENWCIELDVREKSNFDALYDAETAKFNADTRTFATTFVKWAMPIGFGIGFVAGGIRGFVGYNQYVKSKLLEEAKNQTSENNEDTETAYEKMDDKASVKVDVKDAKDAKDTETPATPLATTAYLEVESGAGETNNVRAEGEVAVPADKKQKSPRAAHSFYQDVDQASATTSSNAELTEQLLLKAK